MQLITFIAFSAFILLIAFIALIAFFAFHAFFTWSVTAFGVTIPGITVATKIVGTPKSASLSPNRRSVSCDGRMFALSFVDKYYSLLLLSLSFNLLIFTNSFLFYFLTSSLACLIRGLRRFGVEILLLRRRLYGHVTCVERLTAGFSFSLGRAVFDGCWGLAGQYLHFYQGQVSSF